MIFELRAPVFSHSASALVRTSLSRRLISLWLNRFKFKALGVPGGLGSGLAVLQQSYKGLLWAVLSDQNFLELFIISRRA